MDEVRVFKPKQAAVIMLPIMGSFHVSVSLHPHQKWRLEKGTAYRLVLTNGCVRMVISPDALSNYFEEVEF